MFSFIFVSSGVQSFDGKPGGQGWPRPERRPDTVDKREEHERNHSPRVVGHTQSKTSNGAHPPSSSVVFFDVIVDINSYYFIFFCTQAPRSEVVLVISRCKSDAALAETVGPAQSAAADPVTTVKNGNNRQQGLRHD